MDRSADRKAFTHFEQVLTALTHLPETREMLEQAVDVRFEIRNALFTWAEFGRIEEYLIQAETLARTLDDQRRLGWVSAFMSGQRVLIGAHATEVGMFAQRVETIGDTLGDFPLQVAALYYLGVAGYISGDYRRTESVCLRLMEKLQGDRVYERFGLAISPAVVSLAYLTRALAERGAFEEGVAHGQEAIRIGNVTGHQLSINFGHLGLAYLSSIRGELSQAAILLERTIALCRDWSITLLTPIARAALGHVYVWSGRIEEGVALLKQALTACELEQIGWFHSISMIELGEAFLLANRVEDARACSERALSLTRKRGERGHEAWALRLLGEVASDHDCCDVPTAQAYYDAAKALASELHMRPLVAHCHFSLGKLYLHTGRRQEAQGHLITSSTMYREMDMGFWLKKAEAEIGELEQDTGGSEYDKSVSLNSSRSAAPGD